MAFGRESFNKKKSTALRLTGLFPSRKNPDLLTGAIKASDVEALAKVVETALEANEGLYFMVWDNAKFIRGDNDEGKAPFSLSVDVSKPLDVRPAMTSRFKTRAAAAPVSARRAIEPDPEEANDDPFAND